MVWYADHRPTVHDATKGGSPDVGLVVKHHSLSSQSSTARPRSGIVFKKNEIFLPGPLEDSVFCEASLTLSNPNLPLSSSSTTSREFLPQFSTCSG